MANEDQIDEIEALRAIYDADMTEISTDPPCFMIRLTNIDVDVGGPVSLKFTLPATYPNAHPVIELPMRTQLIPSNQVEEMLLVSDGCAEENLGMPMVYTIVDTVQQWINDNVTSRTEDTEKEEPKQEGNEKSLDRSLVDVQLEEPKSAGGRWDYVIGLVGKPSAGKSTFFNAATTHDTAKTGSHPFTTIEPNIGKAFYSIPCPCHGQEYTCDAAYGHNYKGDRYIPVLLKDVAGLVPGASEGKGRGNRFLNDLLDADVLIHIIDVSGTTNEKGEETQDYDPANDVRWLQEELHQWIYQNIFNKWDAIQRKPSKLIDMFTGYHANRALIHSAIHNAGITEKELATVATWEDTVLHKIVASFLSLRFPMLLALNKADKRQSSENIERLKSEMPDANIIAVSAKAECKLQKMKTEGLIKYELGSNKLEVLQIDRTDEVTSRFITEVTSNILNRFESTNVHNALCRAVTLREPTYAFPVRCLDSLNSVRKHYGRDQDTILRDCISLKPGSKVEDLYNVLCHYPLSLLSGDFVRAETLTVSGEKRPARKDEKIENTNSILKIMTTKRTS